MKNKKATSRKVASQPSNARNTHFLRILLVPLAILVLGVLLGSYVEVRFDHWPPKVTFRPNRPQQTSLLQRSIHQPMVTESSYIKLQNKYNSMLVKYNTLEQVFQEYCNTIWYCFDVISTEVNRKIYIDTNRTAENEREEEAFRCVQICLNKVGYHNGPIDGDWRKTNIAVLKFQKDFCPPDDGKVGIRTWLAMFIKLSQEIRGKVPSQ